MKLQKKLAADVMNCSTKRVQFEESKLKEIKEAITKHDIKILIGKKVITCKQKQGISRARANKILVQKRKGKRQGKGSRKGTANARQNEKETWINKIRKQRTLIKDLYNRKKIDTAMYRLLYRRAKGNFFRSVRHIKLYLEENGVLKK